VRVQHRRDPEKQHRAHGHHCRPKYHSSDSRSCLSKYSR
jgi:hypothetical protein